jgi:hypothetical protein
LREGRTVKRQAKASAEKPCFFAKKNQKTFAKLGFGLSGQAEAKMT